MSDTVDQILDSVTSVQANEVVVEETPEEVAVEEETVEEAVKQVFINPTIIENVTQYSTILLPAEIGEMENTSFILPLDNYMPQEYLILEKPRRSSIWQPKTKQPKTKTL